MSGSYPLDEATRRFDVRAMVALIGICLLLAPYRLQAQSVQGLNIEVLEGEGAINNLRLRTAREAIVQVQDENHKPLAGALVLFSIKGGNPFARTVLSATTDSTGQVRANLVQLHPKAGQFEIHVKASYQGRTATQVIHQTNSSNPSNNASDSASATTTVIGVAAVPAGAGMGALGILIIVGVAAGGVVGGLFGAGAIGGGKSTRISVGTPTL
ncbi:MAG TPA: hypothetical protein VGG72_08930 [Bryobacteraceae bacterium]|jgi:hypothetical protein